MTDELHGKRILVIEDDYLIAEQLAELLSMAGAVVVGPFGWLDEATQAAELAPAIDVALVDVNLHGEKSYPAVDVLLKRNIPVVFMTGYGVESMEAAYTACVQCAKPFSRRDLMDALLLA